MRISALFLRSLALVVLLIAGDALMSSPADAHAGHTHVSTAASQAATHSRHEGAPQAVRVVVTAPVSQEAAMACLTNCCAVGMRCCAALSACAGEIGRPEARHVRQGPLAMVRAGIEPAVPLKPPRPAASWASR